MLFLDEGSFEQQFNLGEFAATKTVSRAFHPERVAFLSALSKKLLSSATTRGHPDLVTVAYFCRKASLSRFERQHLDSSIKNRWGRGVCLHICPGNIPLNFAFSFFMGFLSGNVNLVRLPSRVFPQATLFLEFVKALLQEPQWQKLASQMTFFRSSRNSPKLLQILDLVDAMVVWGGDTTVIDFREKAGSPGLVFLGFPDRVSSCVLNAPLIANSSDVEIRNLAERFYNDTFLVDQNACSSPSLLFWVGSQADCRAAQEIFFASLQGVVDEKWAIEGTNLIEKQLDLFRLCGAHNRAFKLERATRDIWIFDGSATAPKSFRLGVFTQHNLDALEEISEHCRPREQTLTYYGYEPADFAVMCEGGALNVDRIVPVGRALDMGLIWDGRNTIYELSRQLLVE